MKKISSLIFMIYCSTAAVSQNNIGIGTASPSASAMLDISSTTKGLLIPRMTTAQRTAVSSPATGLLVFDSNTKSIWAYDGAAWKNLSASGGGGGVLSLPFLQTVNEATAAFKINNQGVGSALEGSSSHEYGVGINAKTTGEYGWGLFAFSNRHGAKSIHAFSDSGTVFNGENQYSANSNTLMNLLNRGLGKTLTAQLSNNSSTAANMQIAGNHLGEQLLIYQTNATNNKPAVSVNNSGTGTAVDAISTSGTGLSGNSSSGIGVVGISNSNNGVRGITNSGIGFAGVYGANNGAAGAGVQGVANAAIAAGVYGSSTNGKGVNGNSTNGIGLYGSSTNGLALETNGAIKIAGGNTNPTNGAVLTSDAQGNAVWKAQRKVAFKITGPASGHSVVTDNSTKRVQFGTQSFDIGNTAITLSENGNTDEASAFYAPVAGVYHFDVELLLNADGIMQDIENCGITLLVKRNGVVSFLSSSNGARSFDEVGGVSLPDRALFTISTTEQLSANDKVYLEVFHSTGTNSAISSASFSGFLISEL